MQFRSVTSASPSFTNNSSNNLADIAARVVEEFRNENGHEFDDDNDIYGPNKIYVLEDDKPDGNHTENLKKNEEEQEQEQEHEQEEEFEFDVVCRNLNSSHVSADEIFSNGEIVPCFPLFDMSLLSNDVVAESSKPDNNNNYYKVVTVSENESPVVRHPLGELFKEERESGFCSSLTEADNNNNNNLAGVDPGTYCIWKPKVESSERCKKSNSTGNTSKRWRFRNLLQRSNSDGNMKAPVVDLGNFPATKKKAEKVKKVDKTAKVAGADDDGDGDREVTHVMDEINSTNKGGNRMRSYLRYKRDQIGVSANVHR